MGYSSNRFHDLRFDRSRSPVRLPPMERVEDWTVGEPVLSDNGLKTALLTCRGEAILITISEDLYAPFDLSSFVEGAAKKNLDLRLPAAWKSKFECMEACVVHLAQQNAQHLFGEATEGEIESNYKGLVRKNGQFPANLRVKIQTRGALATRHWNADKSRAEAPPSHHGYQFQVRLLVKALWFAQNGSWGIVLEATDLMIKSEGCPTAVCPF